MMDPVQSSVSFGGIFKKNSAQKQAKTRTQKDKSGKMHVRDKELKAYRDTIELANKNMIQATIDGNYETADRFSRIIDSTQAKIIEIINQEDNRKFKQVDSYNQASREAIKNIEAAGKVGGKVLTFVSDAGKQLDIAG